MPVIKIAGWQQKRDREEHPLRIQMGFEGALGVSQILRGKTGQPKREIILKVVLPRQTRSSELAVFYFHQTGGIKCQLLARSTVCHSLDALCIWLPSFRGAGPSIERSCWAFYCISAISPLLRREVLLSGKESITGTLVKCKRRNQRVVDEGSRSDVCIP